MKFKMIKTAAGPDGILASGKTYDADALGMEEKQVEDLLKAEAAVLVDPDGNVEGQPAEGGKKPAKKK